MMEEVDEMTCKESMMVRRETGSLPLDLPKKMMRKGSGSGRKGTGEAGIYS